jgi:hypothetical protein
MYSVAEVSLSLSHTQYPTFPCFVFTAATSTALLCLQPDVVTCFRILFQSWRSKLYNTLIVSCGICGVLWGLFSSKLSLFALLSYPQHTKMYNFVLFGAYAKSQKPTLNFIMLVCLSFGPHGTIRFLLYAFSWNFTFEDFSKNLMRTSNSH